MTEYVTKDSGGRAQFASGMQRDTEAGKPRYDLITPEGVPYQDTMLYRWAMLMARGADKYSDRNWEKAEGPEELTRFRASAFRHFMAWMATEDDEDHAAAVMFNISGAELVKCRLAGEPRAERIQDRDGYVWTLCANELYALEMEPGELGSYSAEAIERLFGPISMP